MLSISMYVSCTIIIFSESSRDCHLPCVQTAHISSPPERGGHWIITYTPTASDQEKTECALCAQLFISISPVLRGTKWAFKLQGPESSVAGGQAALRCLGGGGTRSFTGVAHLTVHPRLREGFDMGGRAGQLEQQALGRQRRSLLSLSGPPQVSASTQRDGGAKRHQFTNKGATSPATKETYVIEPTPEPQLTLTCQPLLISFVNSLCCLPNWGLFQSQAGWVLTRTNAPTPCKNTHFTFTRCTGLFNHS